MLCVVCSCVCRVVCCVLLYSSSDLVNSVSCSLLVASREIV